MWIVFKIDRKKINFFEKEIKFKAGSNTLIYSPKMLISHFLKNKLIFKEFPLLGDYIFCFNENFSDKVVFNSIQYTKGSKFILKGFSTCQKEIEKFIGNCKKFENEKGYISENFFQLKEKFHYKFCTGPFASQVFKILKMEKHKLDVLLGNLKISLNRKKFLFKPQ
mgnify:FL=1